MSIYSKIKLTLKKFRDDQYGVTVIEYAVIAVAIATLVTYIFGPGGSLMDVLVDAINTMFESVS